MPWLCAAYAYSISAARSCGACSIRRVFWFTLLLCVLIRHTGSSCRSRMCMLGSPRVLPGSFFLCQGADGMLAVKKILLMCILSENKYLYPRRRTPMSTLRNISLDLQLGQTILVGKNAEPAEITKIEYHPRTGEIMLNTTRGPRRALTFRLVEQEFSDPADRYR